MTPAEKIYYDCMIHSNPGLAVAPIQELLDKIAKLQSALSQREEQLRKALEENAELKEEVEKVNGFRESLRSKFNIKADTLREALAIIQRLVDNQNHYESALKEAKVALESSRPQITLRHGELPHADSSTCSTCVSVKLIDSSLATINKALEGKQ